MDSGEEVIFRPKVLLEREMVVTAAEGLKSSLFEKFESATVIEVWSDMAKVVFIDPEDHKHVAIYSQSNLKWEGK